MQDFDEIAMQYTPMIHHSIHRLKIYKNQDEFFQFGLIALWEAHERFDDEKGEFSSFAYSYIRGRMLSELKKDKLFEERYVYPEEKYWDVLQGDPEIELDLQLLFNDLTELSNRQKQWVIYTFQYGLTIREIAERENVTLNAVKKWRKSATVILKEIINRAST